MVYRGFWNNLKAPVIGLSPMDGITDAAFRYMVCKYSKPSVVVTEFTNVEGLARGAVKMLSAFIYHEIERPVVAQIYGTEVESYYKAAVMLASMGVDGIDINMGCPANKVAARGSGAGLIRNPKLARELVLITKKAVKDWSEGISLKEAGVRDEMIAACKKMSPKKVKRRLLPVSVKTRIGYDKNVAEEWVKHLIETGPANISMHGRTLKQMYTGRADWDTLAAAAKICKKAGINFLGNGDVSSMEDAKEKIKKYGLDGVLVGRATMGNPWFFGGKEPSVKDRLNAVAEHTKYFLKFLPNPHFVAIRKHLAWYCKGFEGAKELRVELMKVENLKDVEKIVKNAKINL